MSLRDLCGVVALMAFTMAGCAHTTVTVQPERVALVPDDLPPPSVILVRKLSVNLTEVTGDQGFFGKAVDAIDGKTPSETAAHLTQEVADDFTNELVYQINALGLPAQRATRDTSVPLNALVIVGFLTDVDAGNETKRLVIGMGTGESKIDARVLLFRPTAGGDYRTLLEFSTHADSGEATADTVSGAKVYTTAMGAMAARSADKAAAYLSRFFSDHGWIAADKVKPL